jgi:putative membrane protein
MKTIIRVLLTALAVVLLAKLLPGVAVDGYVSAIIVAVVIALLRFIVKPILVVLTIPITILTLGLFLLVINAIIILLADYFIGDFAVDGFWWALIFSVLLSFVQSILFSIFDKDK